MCVLCSCTSKLSYFLTVIGFPKSSSPMMKRMLHSSELTSQCLFVCPDLTHDTVFVDNIDTIFLVSTSYAYLCVCICWLLPLYNIYVCNNVVCFCRLFECVHVHVHVCVGVRGEHDRSCDRRCALA
jgi:hypothetical protein